MLLFTTVQMFANLVQVFLYILHALEKNKVPLFIVLVKIIFFSTKFMAGY